MAPVLSKVEQSDALAVRASGRSPFEKVPFDLLLEIVRHMSIEALCTFVQVNKYFRAFCSQHRKRILLSIIRQTPELETILQLQFAKEADLAYNQMMRPLTVSCSYNENNGDEKSVYLFKGNPIQRGDTMVEPKVIHLTIEDLRRTAGLLRVIDWWTDVEYSDTYRTTWNSQPIVIGRAGLRKAIATWWLYAHYFHGNYRRDPHILYPQCFEDDPRLIVLRVLPSKELVELEAYWGKFVASYIRDRVCSSVFFEPEEGHLVNVPFRPESRVGQTRICATYTKAGPDVLREFHKTFGQQPKRRSTLKFFNYKIRNFAMDEETLSKSLRIVLHERKCVREFEADNTGAQLKVYRSDYRDYFMHQSHDAWPIGRPAVSIEQMISQMTNFMMLRNLHPWQPDGGNDGSYRPGSAYFWIGMGPETFDRMSERNASLLEEV